MPRSLRDYITEAEAYVSGPVAGDEFDIEIAPGDVISTYVLESTEDSVTVYGDKTAMALLETIRRYGAVGSNNAMGYSLEEASLSDLDAERQDWERMTPTEFQRAYGKTKQEWQAEYDQMFNRLQGQTRKAMQRTQKKDPDYCDACDRPNNRCVCESEETVQEDQFFQRVLELAGCGRRIEETEVNTTDPLADKAAALAPVGAQGSQDTVDTIDEGAMKSIAAELGEIADTEDFDRLYDLMTSTSPAGQMVQKIADEISINNRLYDDDHEELLELVMDRLIDDFGGTDLDEAEYQGRNVELNKPKRGGSKKFYVYVKDPKSGNVRKISFGDPNMKIKKSNPARRKSFRARHRCATAKDKTSARYWSCRAW